MNYVKAIVLALFLGVVGSQADAATLTITVNGPTPGAVGVIGPGGRVCNPGLAGGTCNFTYDAGAVLRVTANAPSTPGIISNGTGDAAACATSICTFTLNVDSAITVTFSPSNPRQSLEVVLGGTVKGEINIDNSRCQNYELGFNGCTTYYAPGSEVRMTGGLVPGSIFDRYSGGTNDAVGCGTNSTCTFILNTNSTVSATFAALASIFVSPSTSTVNIGQSGQFNAVATFTNAAQRALIGSGSWQSKRAMSAARFALAAASLNDRFYVMGGSDGVCSGSPCAFAPQNTLEVFTPGDNGSSQFETWTTLAPMMAPREGLAAAAAGGKIYALGGHTSGGGVVASMEVYDPVANAWTNVAPMPTARAEFAAVAIGNTIYAIGGGEPGTPLNTLEAYDLTSNTWTTKSPMPTARSFLAAVTVNGKLYAIGGSPNTAAVEEYDPATDTWTTKASLPSPRAALAAAVINGLIYVVGGQAGSFLSTVDVYNPATDSWGTLSPAASTGRAALAMATVDNRLFAVGGQTSFTEVTASLEVFRPGDVTWWSSNTAVATINATSGNATAVGAGTTTISARSVAIDSGAQSATLNVNSATPTQLLPPTSFAAASVTGNTVTFTWIAPVNSITPTGYLIEGGLTPGQVLGSVPTGSTATTFTLILPTGSFYLRAYSVAGSQRSAASNEIQVLVNVPQPPSAPTNLAGSANGSQLTLSWSNTFTGGTPTGIILDVTGSLALSVPLPLGESFTFNGVPPGTYNFAVRATNAAATSAQSNTVTLTFPGACEPPGVPINFTASRSGNVVSLSWAAAASGPAPSGYGITVTGALNGEFPFSATSISGVLPSGTYNFSVFATSVCGRSGSTAVQTVTVP